VEAAELRKGKPCWKTFRNDTRISSEESAIFGSIFDIEGKRRELSGIEKTLADPAFWGNLEESQKVLRRRKQIEDAVNLAERFKRSFEDLGAYLELYAEGEDVTADLREALDKLEQEVAETETRTLLSGPNDLNSAIVMIHPGAGGTESQDWAEMLLRMYLRWAERRGYKREITDYQPGEEAGLKSVTFLVEGEYAYGYLSAEIGVHRLVRISPYDANARRHTSFASVFVTPEIAEDVEVEVDDKDLRIDTFCSSGPGGQGVNTTYSAVRITHFPSGIVVQCQNERSQHRNKETAMKILRSKLYELKLEEKRKELDELENGKAEIAWGSQIRSYVLHPYRMVKDHRTKQETGDVDSVLDGDMDVFINAFLKQKSQRSSRLQTEDLGCGKS
jgi:peptide chain release factor 2